jgi:hypothetical protein
VWYAVLPTWKRVEDHRWGADRVRLYQVRDPEVRGERALITRDGKTVADVRETLVFLGGSDGRGGHSVGVMEDVTGDGAPDVVIETFSGGAHCCSSTHIVSMGPTPREIAVLETQSEGLRFEREGGEVVMVTADPTFEYWKTAYVSSARPRLVLRFEGGRVVPDARRMWRQMPSVEELDDIRSRVAVRVSGGEPDRELWITTLNMLYGGHEAEGWRFFDSAWPAAVTGKAEFRAELREQLEKSPWWPKVREAFATASGGRP